MNIIKGFVTIDDLVDNTPGVVATLGELSTWSRTYSREKGEYQNGNVAGYNLTSFRSYDVTAGQNVPVANPQVEEILSLVYECVLYANTHIRPYSPTDFKNAIMVAFNQRISNLQFGDFIDNGQLALPAWISWTSLANNNNEIKIWLADDAFRNQYDEYDIVVVPPLDDLDHFFFAYGLAVDELNAISASSFNDKIQIAKDGHPETYTRIMSFDFYNMLNHNQKTSTNWGILIYGQQGDNVDSIKDAIISYILKNSAHPQSDWMVIFPDLFKRTEFIILPRFDLISISNQTMLSGLYKSMMDPKECSNFAKSKISFYTQDWIGNNTIEFPYPYKAISLISVNGDTNVAEKAKLDLLFSDYIPEPSTSPDFNRMELYTRNWIVFLESLLMVAETLQPYQTVPNNMRKITRDGNIYVTAMYDNVNYLVAARSNAAIYPNVT